jgi:hypothetical protein
LRRLGELASTGPYIAQAALAIAVVVPESPVGYIDGARAVQDMMLAAWEMGIGSNWVGNVNTPAIKELLNVPSERMILTIVPFGYPTRKLGKGIKQRKALAEVAHQGRIHARCVPWGPDFPLFCSSKSTPHLNRRRPHGTNGQSRDCPRPDF